MILSPDEMLVWPLPSPQKTVIQNEKYLSEKKKLIERRVGEEEKGDGREGEKIKNTKRYWKLVSTQIYKWEVAFSVLKE